MATHADDGREVRLAFFLRLEFQDGTHKAPTQDYHGSGRVHIHAVYFVEDPGALRLERKASASLDEPGDIPSYVRSSQLDRLGKSPWPLVQGPSRWDATAGRLELHHTAEDVALGVRAYFLDTMDATRCHEDLQEADDD
eukprot:10570184-Lingulodinium_polyedra.AAC.1